LKGLVEFAAEHLGITFFPGQQEVLEGWAASGKRKALLACGRRSGKDLMAGVAAIFNATVPDYQPYLRGSEQRFIVAVATREVQAREFVRAVRELLADAPDSDLRAVVDTDASTVDEIVFKTGVSLRSMPCSSRATRGLAISLLICNEFAHFSSADDGWNAGKQVYRALTPSLSQFGPMGYQMLLSSPLWTSGIFHELYQAGLTGADAEMYVARRPTWEMNDTITRESLESEFLADPESARVEYGAQFAQGGGAFLNAVAVHDCVVKGRHGLPYQEGTQYFAAADPAFAAGGDAFSFVVGHKVGQGESATYVLDVLEAWRGKDSPLSSDAVLDEIAELAKSYRISEVISDQFAVVPLSDGLARRGVHLKAQPLTNEKKADIFTTLKRAINNSEIQLLDHPPLISELVSLELRPSPTGKPVIRAAAGHRDDHAMAVATLIHAMRPEAESAFVMISGDGFYRSDGTSESDDARQGGIFGNRGWHNLFD
jgi:hypothetical protein